MLDKNETLLIEAYKEQTASWKHEDGLLHRFTSIVLPLSVAMLGVPYVQNGEPNERIALLALMGGMLLMTFWGISSQIMHTKDRIRFSIINKLEDKFSTIGLERFRGHDEFRRIRDKAGGKGLRNYRLRVWMFWVYFVVALVVLLSQVIEVSWVNPEFILAWTAILLFFLSFVIVSLITWKARSTREQVDKLKE